MVMSVDGLVRLLGDLAKSVSFIEEASLISSEGLLMAHSDMSHDKEGLNRNAALNATVMSIGRGITRVFGQVVRQITCIYGDGNLTIINIGEVILALVTKKEPTMELLFIENPENSPEFEKYKHDIQKIHAFINKIKKELDDL
ncbi:MAG: roadblock/LC7 domain-containing protein [Candidatus Lokiarchaeota archaeon]|nr:roadblock/LC7 domain-containing protein [Candidatus Lokiarchaeota archaeon]